MEKELAAVGVYVSHSEARLLAQLATATEFEKALLARGLVDTRNEAHTVLRLLRQRAQTERGFRARAR